MSDSASSQPDRNALSKECRRGLYETIARRRDMRRFRSDPIPDETLARILAAADQAPSVGFSQPWNFLLIRSVEKRTELWHHVDEERKRAAEEFEGERRAAYLKLKLEGIRESPLNVLVTCDRTRNGPTIIGRNTLVEMDLYSTCSAVQNLWLAARAEGVGVGWVSILRNETLRVLFGLPDHVEPVAYLCLGFVDSFPELPTLRTEGWLPKEKLTGLVFEESWGAEPGEGLFAALAENDH